MVEYIKSWCISPKIKTISSKERSFKYKSIDEVRLKVGLDIKDLGFALSNSGHYLDEVKEVLKNYSFEIEGENHIRFYFNEKNSKIAPVNGLIKKLFDKEFPGEFLKFRGGKNEICFWYKNRHVKFEVYEKPIE